MTEGSGCVIRAPEHYALEHHDWTVAELKDAFPPNVNWELNWLFLRVGGIHTTESDVGFVILRPRCVAVVYGNLVGVTDADVPWLQECVRKTFSGIGASQARNMAGDDLLECVTTPPEDEEAAVDGA
jgi:hypothetical protein